ncbi:MAG: FCD domain-containing protein [Rhodobacteraceae bacterium]|nr:FCD domain-containing protein [Paracoccaceae bacterium]
MYLQDINGEPAAQTLAESAYSRLRSDIISGKRPAEERLRIERLSRLYDVGPTPLREALQRLWADGLVLSRGNRGFAVAPLDIAEFYDLNVARTAVEKEAVTLSIELGDDDWEAGVVAAAYRLEKQDAALLRDSESALDTWEAANTAFHLATVSACGSRWLLKVRARLHDQCERYRRASVDLRRSERDLAKEHRLIKEAVLDRDVETARAQITEHFATTTQILSDEMTPGQRS